MKKEKNNDLDFDAIANDLDLSDAEDKTAVGTPDARFSLLTQLISTPETISKKAENYQKLEKLIHSDFLKLCAEIGIPGESSFFNELLTNLNDLRDLIEFPYLANKNILAIGGGFSAGKSCFLNSIIGVDQLLPEGLLPTTAIPTYLISSKENEEILALNTFNRLQPLSRESLNSISHAFNTGIQAQSGTISFYHILKLLQIKSPDLKWDNIALLDTPGYSKPYSEEDAANQKGTDAGNTDEEKAREHLSQADYLIWVVSATDGTLQKPDIDFLRDKVKWNRPLYILINKADEKIRSEVEQIFARIRMDAKEAGFNITGISAYSSRNKTVLCGDDPRSWFDDINKKCKYTQWRGRFNTIFEKIIQFNDEEVKRCRILQKGLNPVRMKGDDFLSAEQREQLKNTLSMIDKDCLEHSKAKEQFIHFKGKVNDLLEMILKQIGVTDENASAIGLEGRWNSISGDIPSLKKGEVLEGVVDSLRPLLGCFITAKGNVLNDQIRVTFQDIRKNYTNPEKFFAKGKTVTLTVYDIDRNDSAIIFTVSPVLDK